MARVNDAKQSAQCDKNLDYKGVPWIGFTSHLIAHLRFDPKGNLWGCDCQGHPMRAFRGQFTFLSN